MSALDNGHTKTVSPAEYYRRHAEFHARVNPSGVGSAVARSTFENGDRVWDCIVDDGHEWHYVRVLSCDLGPFPNLGSEDIEDAIERFARTLPAPYRIRHLLNANPLHLGRDGNVRD
jgi:hypothetical protein